MRFIAGRVVGYGTGTSPDRRKSKAPWSIPRFQGGFTLVRSATAHAITGTYHDRANSRYRFRTLKARTIFYLLRLL